jgi:hypothetical protein
MSKKLAPLAGEIGVEKFAVDASNPAGFFRGDGY